MYLILQHPAIRISLAVAIGLPPTLYSEPQLGWMRRDSRMEYQLLTAPGDRFTLEYPKRDWRTVPGGGSVMVTLVQKNSEAAVVIEYTRLDPPLGADEITDLFPQIEVDELKKRQPGATGFRPRLVTGPQGRQSQVDFVRPGSGGDEQVRQISMPRGADLYRIVCSAPAERFSKYEPIFGRILGSFRARAQ